MDYHEKGNVLWGEYLILVENDSFDVLGALCKECFSLFFSFKSVNAIYILLTFIYFCQAQFQWASQAKFSWTEISFNPGYYPHPTHPRESRFEPLLDYLGNWNSVWKLNSTKLDQLAN